MKRFLGLFNMIDQGINKDDCEEGKYKLTKDAFGAIKEMDAKNDEKKVSGRRALKIIEIEFLKNIK